MPVVPVPHSDSVKEFERFPEDLIGTVQSVTVGRTDAVMGLVTSSGTVPVTLYSDDDHPGALTPRDGMWRGAILGLAQRALTHQHKVTVATVERRIGSYHVWMTLSLSVHREERA